MMNDEERSELLRQVAECAPKEMRAKFEYSPGYLHRTTFRRGFDEVSMLEMDDNDHTDATGIVAMLDAIEKAGYVPRAQPANEASYRCDWKHKDEPRNILMRTEKGSTRAEAVARAFVQVFAKRATPVETPQDG